MPAALLQPRARADPFVVVNPRYSAPVCAGGALLPLFHRGEVGGQRAPDRCLVVDQMRRSVRILVEVPSAGVLLCHCPQHTYPGTRRGGGVSQPLHLQEGSTLLFHFFFFFCFVFYWVGKEMIASPYFLFKLGSNTLQQVEEVADCLWQSPTLRDR